MIQINKKLVLETVKFLAKVVITSLMYGCIGRVWKW
jgi:hypothetical protein